jgi:hypothetical protein
MTVAQTAIAVQTALYSALTSAVSGLTPVPGVYDSVPKGVALPYVVIDAQQALDGDALVARRDDVFFYLSVWSDYPGQKQVLTIMDAIRAALHRQRLDVSTGRVVTVRVASLRTERDVDEQTYQGIITLRLLVERGTA